MPLRGTTNDEIRSLGRLALMTVIPAKAGIQPPPWMPAPVLADPHFRGDRRGDARA